VTDILLWVEGFSQLVAVLASLYPSHIHEFMAYLRTIVRASRNYEGPAWAAYDVAYRRQAAASRDLHWGRVEATLYSEAFTGRARALPRCRYCLGDSHTSDECSYAPPPAPQQPPAHYQPSLPSQQQIRPGGGNRRSVEICQRYNRPDGDRCILKSCRFAHLCLHCQHPHPAADCRSGNHDSTSNRSHRHRSPRK
jgi:hypothetical protein